MAGAKLGNHSISAFCFILVHVVSVMHQEEPVSSESILNNTYLNSKIPEQDQTILYTKINILCLFCPRT